MMGTSMSLIPTSGDEFYKTLMTGVTNPSTSARKKSAR